jgi:hypothetical protein
MTNALRRLSRRGFLVALLALPAIPVLRKLPAGQPDDIVELNGWILKRSDLS